LRKRRNVRRCSLASGVRAGLNHAAISNEEFGAWINGEAVEQRLQFGPKSVTAQSGNRVEFAHSPLPFVSEPTLGTVNQMRHPIADRRKQFGNRVARDNGTVYCEHAANRDNPMTQDNKTVVARWFKEFWGNPWNPEIINELATSDIFVHYPMHEPKKGRDAVLKFMTEFRDAFPDLNFRGVGELIAEGDFVVGRWEGGGTHTGRAFSDFRLGSIVSSSGRKMKFAGTTVLRLENGRIAEELGQEDALSAMLQLGLIRLPEADMVQERRPLPHGWNNMPPPSEAGR
jgi:predicted ester cyclase